MAFPNLSDIVTTTIQNRSGKLADNTLKQNALLAYLNERGNVKPFSGGNVIMQELMYNDPNTQNAASYSGFDVIDITPNSPLSSAQFDIKQYAAAVTISGLEQLQNASKQAIIDLLEGRIAVAEKQLMNQISAGVYSDGTGNGGKDITGLAAAISTTPATGTYGGINRATNPLWQTSTYDAATDFTGITGWDSTSARPIIERVAALHSKGRRYPSLFIGDLNSYQALSASMVAHQRIVTASGSAAKLGFNALQVATPAGNVEFLCATGVGSVMPANTVYAIDPSSLEVRYHRSRNMVPLFPGDGAMPINQDAIAQALVWNGELVFKNPRYSARIVATPTA